MKRTPREELLAAIDASPYATLVKVEPQAWFLPQKSLQALRDTIEPEGLAAAVNETPARPGAYLDIDSDESFLDLPELRYQNGTTSTTGEELDRQRDPKWRRAHGRRPLPKLPPPIDR